MKKKLSIKDIAAQLNVSTTTVSFILNGKAKEKRITDDMVEKVLGFVDKVGYKPNLLAQSLRTGKSNIIGLLVENIANPFFATIARQIEDIAYKNGYKIIYTSTDDDTQKTKNYLQIFKDRQVDGYIIAPPMGIEKDIIELVKTGKPVVLFDRLLPELTNVDYVGINGEESVYHAMLHLRVNGFKNIAFITTDSLQTQMEDRLSGYEKAAKELGLATQVKRIPFNQTKAAFEKQITSFLQKNSALDAVIFATNYLGVSGLKAIKLMGLNIPKDIGVLVFDDNDLFELHTPSISTIAQPIEAIAQQVISILLNKLNTPIEERLSQTILLPTKMLIRNSTRHLFEKLPK